MKAESTNVKPQRKVRRKKIRSPRRRHEFDFLWAQLEPDFEEKAWRQFIDSLLYDIESTKSYQDQFKIRARAMRAEARRDRRNAKRRRPKREAFMQQLKPQYPFYISIGLVDPWIFGQKFFNWDMFDGALPSDVRLSRKLLREFDVVDRMMNPTRKPWDIVPLSGTVETEAVESAERQSFLSTLEATPVPIITENVPFSPLQDIPPSSDEQPSIQDPAAAAYAS